MIIGTIDIQTAVVSGEVCGQAVVTSIACHRGHIHVCNIGFVGMQSFVSQLCFVCLFFNLCPNDKGKGEDISVIYGACQCNWPRQK